MLFRFLPLVLILAGCAEVNPIKTPEAFDPKTVSRISFLIEEYGDSQLQNFESTQLNGVSREISERFTEAGYSIANGQEPTADIPRPGDRETSGTNGYTHVLQASVGAAALTETPPGFTLDFGNVDPRAQNFQKTTTVDVTCRLSDPEDHYPPIVLSERKAIPARIAKMSVDGPENFEKVRRYYVENIGATCHNLLTKLDIYPTEPEQPDTGPKTWGRMQIQTEYEAEPSGAPATKSDPKPAKTNGTPAKATASPGTSMVSPALPVAPKVVVPEPAKPSPLQTETRGAPQPQPSTPEPIPPGHLSSPPDIRAGEAETPAPQVPAVLDSTPNQSPPAPVAMEKSVEPGPSEVKQDETPRAVTTRQDKTGDWRKKKITIFNQGSTVILKFGPER